MTEFGVCETFKSLKEETSIVLNGTAVKCVKCSVKFIQNVRPYSFILTSTFYTQVSLNSFCSVTLYLIDYI